MKRNALFIILLLILAKLSISQEASLDRDVYWLDQKDYAVLRIVMPEPGLNLKVFLWDQTRNTKKVIINKQINTTDEKFFEIDLKKFLTGYYSLDVYFGIYFFKSLKMTVINNLKKSKKSN